MDFVFVLWLFACMITVIIIILTIHIILHTYYNMYSIIIYAYINCVKKHSHFAHIAIYLIIICQFKYQCPGFHTYVFFVEFYLCSAQYKCSPDIYSLHIPECGIHDVMNNLMCQFDILSKSTQIIILYLAYIIYMFHCLTCTCMLIAISEIKLSACRNMYYRQGYLYIKHYSTIHVTVTSLIIVLIIIVIRLKHNFPEQHVSVLFGKINMQIIMHVLLYLKNNELYKYIIMTSAIHVSNNSMFGTLIYYSSRFKWNKGSCCVESGTLLLIHMIVMIYSIMY